MHLIQIAPVLQSQWKVTRVQTRTADNACMVPSEIEYAIRGKPH